jgi:hypothetical protein
MTLQSFFFVSFIFGFSLITATDNPFDVKKLDPTCEQVWEKSSPDNSQNTKVFKYPSELISVNESSGNTDWPNRVYCIPTELIRFTQNTVTSHTSSGQALDDWIAEFKSKGSFDKKNLPDIINWGNGIYTSLDNRRVFCAKKAGIAFVPARIYAPEDELIPEYQSRFKVTVQGYYFNGTQIAKTYGEAAAFRSIGTGPGFSMFGEIDLPRVVGPPQNSDDDNESVL